MTVERKVADKIGYGEWLPIETAPKDGTWVLIFEEWNTEKPHKNWTISRFHNGKWSYRQTFGPTHWMPLPSPPEDV